MKAIAYIAPDAFSTPGNKDGAHNGGNIIVYSNPWFLPLIKSNHPVLLLTYLLTFNLTHFCYKELSYIGKSNPAFPICVPEDLGGNPLCLLPRVLPEQEPEKLIEMYAITGGVPKYIELFSESWDIYSAIDSCVLNRSGYL